MERLKRAEITYQEGESLASNATKLQVDEYASKVAASLKFNAGDDVEAILKELGGRVHYESAFVFMEEDATIVVHGPRDFDVALTMLGQTRRDRFTLAHELGHYLLHSRQGKYPMTASRKGSNRLEWEANWFAAGFLMPATEMKKLVAKGMSKSDIADHFKVSEAAVEVRKKALGI